MIQGVLYPVLERNIFSKRRRECSSCVRWSEGKVKIPCSLNLVGDGKGSQGIGVDSGAI